MKQLLIYILAFTLVVPLSAQKKRGSGAKRATTQKVDRKTQLRNEQNATQQKRKQSQAHLAQLNKSVKASLDSVLVLDNKIGKQQTSIDSLGKEVSILTTNIANLETELAKLQEELYLKKQRYAKAMIYIQRHKSAQSKLMFIFSAQNFSQMARRMRYVREYSTFIKAQGEILKTKQAQVKAKQNELLEAKTQMELHLQEIETQKKALVNMKQSCQAQVDYLNKNISTVQQQIKEYQQKEAALNAEIDRIIQAEIEAARRAEAERKRKQEEAKRKAEAEAREKAKRLAEAKAAAERARKAEAGAAAARKAAKSEAEKSAAKEAEEKAKAATKAAEAEVKTAEKEERAERSKVDVWKSETGTSSKLSNNFASNKGRLPMPITGNYSIVGHYGNYSVAGLKNVTLDNKGIDIRGQQGCSARAVFDGTVSSVFQYGGAYIVMLRHGSYISVYSGLSSVNVRKGQNVKTRDSLGAVSQNSDGYYVLHFQLRQESSRLNPEQWVR